METQSSDHVDISLLDLSDCLMITILSYLDATSLFQLSKTCSYFKNIVEDLKLWRYIDARAAPNTTEKTKYCVNKIHERTTHILFRAKNKKEGVIPVSFFSQAACFENIRILALEKQYLNGESITMDNFPRTLEELSLRQTYVKHSMNFFRFSHENKRKLKVLVLDECEWVVCSFIMSLALYENLEIVSTVKCDKLIHDIAYLSLARHGYKKLKVFDCRFTGLGHNMLKSFYKSPTLLSIYFQNEKAYENDNGKKLPYMHFYAPEEIKDFLDLGTTIIGDESLIDYISTSAMESNEELPESFLYEDPYGKCTCGYMDGVKDENLRSSTGNASEESSTPPTDQTTNNERRNSTTQRAAAGYLCKKHRPKRKKEEPKNSDSEYDSSSDDELCQSCMVDGQPRTCIVVNIFTGQNGNQPNENAEPEGNNAGNNANYHRPNAGVDAAGPSRDVNVNDHGSAVVIDFRRRNPYPEYFNRPGNRQITINATTSGQSVAHTIETSETRPAAPAPDPDHAPIVLPLPPLPSTSRDTGGGPRGIRLAPYERTLDDRLIRLNRMGEQSHKRKLNETGEGRVFKKIRVKAFDDVIYKRLDALVDDGSSSDEGPNRNENAASNENSDESPRVERPTREGLVNAGDNPNFSRNIQVVQVNNFVDSLDYIRIRGREEQRMEQIRHFQRKTMKETTKIPLRRLSLRGFNLVTDIGLRYIKDLNINLLDLTYTGVTQSGIEMFLSYNPGCRIIHPKYCKCKPKLYF